MTDAEAEIRATITVQTTESSAAKKSEKDTSHGRMCDTRRGTVIGGGRDTLVTGKPNFNLDHVTKFFHYLSFTVHFVYSKIERCTPVSFIRTVLDSFYLLISYFGIGVVQKKLCYFKTMLF